MRGLVVLLTTVGALAFAADDASPDTLERGREVYFANCVMCHGPNADGRGELAADLSLKPRNFKGEPLQWGNSQRSIETTVRHGRSDVMPTFEDVLTPAQIADVAAFVWSQIPGELKARRYTPRADDKASRVFLVVQKGRAFVPAKLSVHVNDSIVFINEDDTEHEVHDLGAKAGPPIRSQQVKQWDRVQLTNAGTVVFGCFIHPAMRLEVTVKK